MRYAKALFAYSEATNTSDEVFREMEDLARGLATEPRFRQFLQSPILGRREKMALIKSAISERVTRPVWRFIGLVVRNHRVEMLYPMTLNYLDLYRKARNINTAIVETATPLTPQTEERLKAMLCAHTHGTVELIKRTNPDLIGGFVFQMNYQRIDGSVSSQLTEMKKHFMDDHRQITRTPI